MLEKTKLVGMRLDRITTDVALATKVGCSPANTNNALRTLSRMLSKAYEWKLIRTKPVIKLVEEFGRDQIIEPWMEQKLLIVTAGERLTPKGRVSTVGWEPFRTVLLIMLDTGLRPAESFPHASGEHPLGSERHFQSARQEPEVSTICCPLPNG